jgi:hypothetical protein
VRAEEEIIIEALSKMLDESLNLMRELKFI